MLCCFGWSVGLGRGVGVVCSGPTGREIGVVWVVGVMEVVFVGVGIAVLWWCCGWGLSWVRVGWGIGLWGMGVFGVVNVEYGLSMSQGRKGEEEEC